MVKKLVISYSDDDLEIAKEVHTQLSRAGYDIWIAHEDIKGDVHWTKAILEAIDSRDGLVLVWSQFAAKSENVHEEIRLARVFGKPVFPILAYPMTKVPSLPEEINTLQVIEGDSFDLSIAKLKQRLADPERSEIDYPRLVKNVFIPIAQNPYFVDRDRQLKDLFIDIRGYRGATRKDVPIAISGLAGIGKTELALEFGYRFNFFFPDGVYWVNALKGFVPELGKIGPRIGVEMFREERPREYALRVLEKLEQLREGLIIFDNITNFNEFGQWCPSGSTSCSVILTTRMSPRAFRARVMTLFELDSDSAYELLLTPRNEGEVINYDKVQQEALKEICRIIGNHPLALDLCASRLQSGFIQPADYLPRIQLDPLGIFEEAENIEFRSEGSLSLLKVLQDSYTSLDQKLVDPYFLLMCCFAPHGINEKLIVQAYGAPGDGGQALDQLAKFSLIRHEVPGMLSLHPLVAQFGRDLLKQKDDDYPGKFVEVMLRFLRTHAHALASEEVRREKPHIDQALKVAQERELWEERAQLLEYEAGIETGIQEQIEALDKAYQIIEQHLPQQKRKIPGLRLRLGKAHRTAGRLHEALADFNQAAVLYGEFGDIDPAEAASLGFELGDTQLALGQYAEAEKTLSEALAAALTNLDDSAPEVLQLRQALARRALYLGDYDTAAAGFSAILGHREKYYNTQPDAASAAGLASAHADLSRLALARALYDDAIRAAEAALRSIEHYSKESDPDRSHIHLLLGTIHYEAGKYSQAEQYLEQAQQEFLTTFGERHPSYARVLIALGEVYRKQGKFDKAEKEAGRAIAIFEHVYGASHPFLAEALGVKAKIYDHRCEFDKEQAVWEQVLEIQLRSYSERHPALATTYHDYANFYMRKGEYDKALELLDKSLDITEKSLGETHASYFGRLILLATCRYEQQEYLLAQKILDRAKGLQNRIFGDAAHPYIARMLQLQSEVLRRLGRFSEALEAIDQAIAMKKAIYGTEEHPSVAEAFEVKIKIFHHQGERIEAKLLIDRTLEIRRKAYGEDHPEVSRSVHDLGSYYLRLGQYEAAAEQFERARQITATVFGERHPDYIERTLNLANAVNEQGEYQLALDLVKEIEAALPVGDHYLTARWLQLMGELQRRMGQFDIAMDYIERAIAMKKKIYGSDLHPSVAEALGVKAKIYDHRCEFDREQEVWEQVLEIQLRSYSEQHPVLATTYHDYANFNMRKGEYDKALELLDKSLDITEKSLGETHASYFGRLILLATCRYEQQEYLLAQKILDRAKGLQNRIFGDAAHPYIARMLQLQSEVLRRLGRLSEALEVINQAIAMKITIYGTEEHPSIAEALEVKVDLLLSQLQFPEAGKILDTIERIRRITYGENHPEYADYQMRRAGLDEKMERFEVASKILEQSLRTYLSVYSGEHPDTIRRQIMLARIDRMANRIDSAEARMREICETLGARLETEESLIVAETFQELSNIRRAVGDYHAALAELEKALRIKTKIFSSESPDVIELQNEKAKLLILFRRFSEAENIIESALRYTENYQPIYMRLKSNLLEQGGILQDQQKKYEHAIKSLDEAIKLKYDLLGDESVELAKIFIEKAVVLRHQGKYNEALKDLEAAHNIDNLHFNDADHPYFARILLEQGQIYLGKRSILAAQDHLKEALKIYEKRPNRNVKQHAEAAEALGRNYLENELYREASQWFQKALDIRTAIYGSTHPEIARVLNYQAQAILKMAERSGNPQLFTQARQKLAQALEILPASDDDPDGELRSAIENTLENL